MKAVKIMLFVAVCIPLHLFAENTDTTSKIYFYKAKQELENMLSGKKPMSYEEAIYQIENAWYEGGIDYNIYKHVLDTYTKKIFKLATSCIDSKMMKSKSDFTGTQEQKRDRYVNAVLNYAIYRYMTNPTVWVEDNHIVWHRKYSYSTKDPMGTTNWENTQVTHLINKNKGNCFALASLYKIFADRLNAEAILCTAPGHIYIRNADDKGVYYNVELSSRAFPGTGTIETLTYTTNEAAKNNISIRELNLKQSIALCLVYLAKGYEYKFNLKDDDFILNCAETALTFDEHNLNAMLLKAEVLENRLAKQSIEIFQIKKQKNFQKYQDWITHIFELGYREMPFEMKNVLIKGWTQDTIIQLATTEHTTQSTNNPKIIPIRYASLSWGLFDEEIRTKPFERFGNTVYDTKNKKIVAFLKDDILYNQYNFDPVVFAWSIDPMAHKFPNQSPYTAFGDNPIYNIDVEGAYKYPAKDAANYAKTYPMITLYLAKYVQNDVKKSPIIQNAVVKNTYGGYTKEDLVNHVTAWNDKNSPEITFEPGLAKKTGAYGHTSDSKHFQIDADFAKAMDNMLANKDVSEKDKQAAITNFVITLMDETTHTGDLIDKSKSADEVGKDATFEIWRSKTVTIEGTGYNVDALEDNDPTNTSDVSGTKQTVERKIKEGKPEVIPTVPKKE